MLKLMWNRKRDTSEEPNHGRRPGHHAHSRAASLLRLGFVAALLLSVTACRGNETGDPRATATPTGSATTDAPAVTAYLVATAVAATRTAQPSAAPATPAPTPPRHPLVGRWHYEHAEEGLNYVQVYEFFADGLYTEHVTGLVSYCYLFPGFPGCDIAPNLPVEESASGTYEFLSDTQVRLRDTAGQLSAFTIVELTPSRLVTLEDDEQRVYERRP